MRRSLLPLALVWLAACGGASPRSTTAEELTNDPLDGVSGEELFRRGGLLARAGDLIRAEQYFAAAIRNGFPEEEAMPALMHVCVEASRLVAALQYAEPYLARHPEAWSLRMLVASIHMGMQHDEQARDHLALVVRDAPEDAAQAHYFLAVLYRDRFEDRERAAEHFRGYLAIEPEGSHSEEARAGLSTEPNESSGQGGSDADAPRLPQRVEMPTTPEEREGPTPQENDP